MVENVFTKSECVGCRPIPTISIFNTSINDLIMVIEKSGICNFADDNTLYKSRQSLSVVLNRLEHDIRIVLNWFKVSSLKAKPQKFEFIVLGGKYY